MTLLVGCLIPDWLVLSDFLATFSFILQSRPGLMSLAFEALLCLNMIFGVEHCISQILLGEEYKLFPTI